MASGASNETQINTIYSNITEDTNHWSTLYLIIVNKCNKLEASSVRLPIEILSVLMGLPSNVALLWLLVRGRKALSPSEVLGLNLALLNIIFCLCLPLDMYLSLRGRSGLLLSITEANSILNILGCPLLLASMCAERYMAAAHAVLYMKLGSKWEYRAVCCALIWIFTLATVVITFFQRLPKIAMYLSLILNIFLLFMVACLLGIVRILCKKGPGAGQAVRGGSSVKNRALQNTLAVLVPSVFIYGPILGLAPYLITLKNQPEFTNSDCNLLNLVHTFPSLGVCIGPAFYMSRARQLLCWKEAGKEQTTNLELEQPE